MVLRAYHDAAGTSEYTSVPDAWNTYYSAVVSMPVVVSVPTGCMVWGENAWVRGVLELLEHIILLDAAHNDDAGGDAELLAREVDLLGWLRAPELVDRKRVTIDTAKGEACRRVSGA